MQLTTQQIKWLSTRGGRKPDEVAWYKGIPFVLMYDGYLKEWKEVRVPKKFAYFMENGHVRADRSKPTKKS